jgi:hypothetical protein
MNDKKTIKGFISYAHNDDRYYNVFIEALKKNLKNSKDFKWDLWDDQRIQVGCIWDEEIQQNLEISDIAIFLVSSNFISSNYIEKKEFENLVNKWGGKKVLLFPVLFGPCDLNQWPDLAKLQFFRPSGDKYSMADKKDFTFADLVDFNRKNGQPIDNPDIIRYVLDLSKELEQAVYTYFTNIRVVHEESTGHRNRYPYSLKPFFDDDVSLSYINSVVQKYNLMELISIENELDELIKDNKSNEKIIHYKKYVSNKFEKWWHQQSSKWKNIFSENLEKEKIKNRKNIFLIIRIDCSKKNIKDLTPISNFPQVEVLNGSHNDIQSLEPIKNLKRLQKIDFSCTKINTIKILFDLPYLEMVGVINTKVKMKEINELKRLKPNCKIWYYL